MLRKQAAKFGMQWDKYLSGVLWAYRNTPHSTTGEKPSFLLFGFDCRSPTEAALLSFGTTDVSDFREQMMLSLSTARNLAIKTSKEAQRRYRLQYDKTARTSKLRVGDWALVYFPQDETGKTRKLSQPWHGPYRIISRDDPDMTVTKIYFPDHPPIRIHRSRVQKCPLSFPSGFYWYGAKRSRPGRPPKQVLKQLATMGTEMEKYSPTQISDQIGARDVQTVVGHTVTKSTSSQETLAPDITQLKDGQLDNTKKSTDCSRRPKTTKRNRNSQMTKQPVMECPYSLKSRMTLGTSLSERGNDVK